MERAGASINYHVVLLFLGSSGSLLGLTLGGSLFGLALRSLGILSTFLGSLSGSESSLVSSLLGLASSALGGELYIS